MYAKSKRTLRFKKIPTDLKNRITKFLSALTKLYKKRKRSCPSNLLAHQEHCFSTIKRSEQLLVWKTDKNLGPCVSERTRYLQLCRRDHFNDTKTYERLAKVEADNGMEEAHKKYASWRRLYAGELSKEEKTFLLRTTILKTVTERRIVYRYPVFYALAKVHKESLKTRPIVSCSGSFLEGIGKWADRKLQPFGRATTAFISSSRDLLEKLKTLPLLPPTARLFTCDAQSMYTNIDTTHALKTLRKQGIPKHVLAALSLIMRNNFFRFSDTYWHQLNGTAMGTPPA
jgi:hypothetical protein